MGRPATGTVIAPDGPRQKSWALRFTAYGKRRFVTLGTTTAGWDRRKAEAELRHVLADVERGIWQPQEVDSKPEPAEAVTFHALAEEWLAIRELELRPRTIEDYRWSLECHLLATFGQMPVTSIDVKAVDDWKVAKLRESERRQRAIDSGEPIRDGDGAMLRPLGANGINKVLDRLAAVLDFAIDRELIETNPARGRRRRLKGTKPKRPIVEIEQVPALLAAADPYMRPLVALLIGAGLRISEACRLDWRDLDLGKGTVRVGQSKTEAGEDRLVDLPIGAVDELRVWKATSPSTQPSDPVFVTRARGGVHGRQTRRNALARLKATAGRANVALVGEGIEAIDLDLTNHSLRRTWTSIRFACGDDPIVIAEQGGWEDPSLPMRLYAKAGKRRAKLIGVEARAFDEALAWSTISAGDDRGVSAGIGREAESADILAGEGFATPTQQTASQSRNSAPTPA